MTNAQALYEWCNSIANTFYPSHGIIALALANAELGEDTEYVSNDIKIIKAALELVQGFVADNQKEGDLSNSTYWEAVRANIMRISNKYGLDASEYISLSSIQDMSIMW